MTPRIVKLKENQDSKTSITLDLNKITDTINAWELTEDLAAGKVSRKKSFVDKRSCPSGKVQRLYWRLSRNEL